MYLVAIQKKLNCSNIPLEDRCIFARNVFLTDSKTVNVGQKDALVVDWVVSILMKKFSQSTELSEDAPLWKFLLEMTDSTRFELNFLSAAPQEKLWDLLNSTVDHSSQYKNSELPAKWLQMLFRNNRYVRAEMFKRPESLNHFISKCLQNAFVVNDAIWLYNGAVHQTGNIVGSNFHEVLLPKLLTVKKTSTSPESTTIQKLVGRSIFAKDKASLLDSFLTSVIDNKDDSEEQKPRSTELVENLFNKVSSMSYDDQILALKMLFKSGLFSNGISNQSKAQLFCLFCNVLQLYPLSDDALKMIPLASTLLPKFKMDLELRIECVHYLIKSLIDAKFDLSTLCLSTVETSGLLKFIQHLLKYLLDNHKAEWGHLICDMAVNLAKYSPMVIEPLIGTLSLSVIILKRSDFMCHLITLYHKLRQLPKLIARLLIAMDKSNLNPDQFVFDGQSLQCFAEKVTTLPVGQVLDLWKTFDYHLKNAVTNSENSLTTIIDQIMSTFVLNSCLVEQGIPDLTMDKILANIKTTLELIQSKSSKFSKLENSLNEICIMLAHTRPGVFKDLIPVTKDLSHLQKRKLENVNENGGKKARMNSELIWSDIKLYPKSSWKSLMPDLEDAQLEVAIDDIAKTEPIDMIRILLEEDHRAQMLLLTTVIKEINGQKKSNFLELLLRYVDVIMLMLKVLIT